MLSLAAAVPYYFRRHAPLAVLLISEAAVVVLTVRDYQTGAAPSVLLVGVFTVAAWSSVRDRVIGVTAMALGLSIVAVSGIPGAIGADIVFNVALYAAAYLFGSTMRNRRLYSEQLEERANALESERAEEAKRAVAEERLRIAQELHDVVAHSMGVIAVQAGVGAHVIDTDPAEAKKSLGRDLTDEPFDACGDSSHARCAPRRRGRVVRAGPGARRSRSTRAGGSAGRDSRWTCAGRVRAPNFRPVSTSPPTGSCRRR